MVAAGATALMAAGDSGTSKTADNAIQDAQQLNSDSGRRSTAFSSRKRDSLTTPNKTASIRETKASRLRAASIISPTDGSHGSRRTGFIENTLTTSRSSPNTSTGNFSTIQKSSTVTRSSSIPQILSREREKHRQLSSKMSEANEKFMDSNASERTLQRRPKRSTKASLHPSSPSVHPQKPPSRLPSSVPRSSIPAPSVSKTTSQNSTEVLERVDALTALTKATMERVERLTSSSPSPHLSFPTSSDSKPKSPRPNSHKRSLNDEKMNPSAPVSILKNKSLESADSLQKDSNPPSVAFKLDERIIKKHGILKKRSSLDESEILRRTCNSPDSILINNDAITSEEFRSILKYERRSSLDELVKCSKTIDQQNPPSILKRKWLKFGGDDDKEEVEPQGILKKNSQSLIDAVAKTLGVTWTESESESTKEVRPILKKKLSHDESSSSDPPSLEPRPILKKKSSTESEEHEDKPRKTILKYSRKNSEESSNECETLPNSPKKLTVINQNSLQRRTNSLPECATTNFVKPILKNSRSRSIQNDLVLRKRARSVGHDSNDLEDDRIERERRDEEQIVTFEFPNDDDDYGGVKLGFNGEEAARRRLDDCSAKARRDKRFSRRNRDRREVVEQSLVTSDLFNEDGIKKGENFEGFDGGRSEESFDRFCTQPVTYQEVQEATGLIRRERSSVEEEGSLRLMGDEGMDPSKLSLAERVKLFNRKIATESVGRAEGRGQKRTVSRFRTQPVTSEEVEDARNIPNALVTGCEQGHSAIKRSNAASSEPARSILKSTSSTTVSTLNHRLSSIKLDSCSGVSQEFSSPMRKLSEKPSEAKNYSDNTVPSYETTDTKLITNIITKHRTTNINNFDNLSRDKNHCKSLEAVENLRAMKTAQSLDSPSLSIAERLAALKRSGSTDWKRRVITESLPVSITVDKSIIIDKDMEKRNISQREKEELVITQKRLADRLEKLESAAEGWRKRVTTADAVKFSVAGKMRYDQIDTINDCSKPVFESMGNCTGVERKKKTPRKDEIKRAISVGEDTRDTSDKKISEAHSYNNGVSDQNSLEVSIQQVPRADDETFTSFYDGMTSERSQEDSISITEDDLDLITTGSELLGSRRTTQVQRRRVSASHNPLRTLAARTDLKSEYTEMRTGVAERMLKLKNIEKIGKNSSLAVEALAGLASTENFSSISLKNIEDNSTGFLKLHPKNSETLLILIKGRRHVQVRLIEPSIASINSGDNFILVTRTEIYHYIGKYSNVIEKSRASEIAMSILQTKDLGCKAQRIITINEELTMNSADSRAFWKLLGHTDQSPPEIIDAGHPDEDELYESALIDTNVVYEVVEGELIALDKYWGTMPKIKMLDPLKILIFDFGTEMYIWNGKCAPPEARRASIKLAESLWNEGYDYADCSISPITAASIIGRRSPQKSQIIMREPERPSWCLLAKLTQHMETILFREKFLDWPNAYGIIKCKTIDGERDRVDGKIVLEPPDVDLMINKEHPPVDLVLEGCHLGRGTEWFDEEFSRQYLVTTTDVTIWHIDEYSYSRMNCSGGFFSGDSYIIRWMYLITVTGRELSGLPSRHAVEGRDRCAYFIWQGKSASVNKQGTAALLTVELDKEQGPQIRVVEGSEPPAFLNLFRGGMIVYSGKQSDRIDERGKIRAFFCRGTRKSEVSLLEVPYSSRQLRTRGSLIFINHKIGVIYVWYGKSSLPHIRSCAFHAAEIMRERRPVEAGFEEDERVRIVEIDEGQEPEDLLQGGMNRKLYGTINRSVSKHTPRLFHFSSISGEFEVSEVLCPQRSEDTIPFPFLQEELYQVSQPTLFLFDNKDELWLWQGWWPDTGSDDQTGSGAVRWQAERRAAMTAALQYWKILHNDRKKCQIFLVWAGLEPLEFINLFPTWSNRDDIAELNMKDGRAPGEMLSLEKELTRLTQSTYPPAQLLQRPLPEGVDPTSLELYLSPQHFQELLRMNIEEFQKLPSWKQIDIKKKIGLF